MDRAHPVQFPTTDFLLSKTDAEKKDPAWLSAFDAAAVHEYTAAWFKWYFDNRDSPVINSEEMFQGIFPIYNKTVAENMPWFTKALRIVQKSDPKATKPIVALFLRSMAETLSSTMAFQVEVFDGRVFTPREEVYDQLMTGMIALAKDEPSRPLLFSANSNAYEHMFSFYIRMFCEFGNQYGRSPDPNEFEQLSHQLLVILGKEARLSRKENAVFEQHFDNTTSFFSFSQNGESIKLDAVGPTPEERERILARHEKHMSRQERENQTAKALLGVHYGCPVVGANHQGTNPILFIFNRVKNVLQRSLYTPNSVDPRILGTEKRFRELVSGPAPI